MESIKRLYLKGHNFWGPATMLESWVDFGDDTAEVVSGAALADRLTTFFSALPENQSSWRQAVVARCRAQTPLAEVLAELTLALQVEAAGEALGYWRAEPAAKPNIWKVAVECRQHALAHAALGAAIELLSAAAAGRAHDLPGTLEKLRQEARELQPAPIVEAISATARTRDIPCQLLGAGNIVQLGHGARQRRLHGLQTDRTPATAVAAAHDVATTHRLLRIAGIPTIDRKDIPAGAVCYRLLIVSDRLVAATTTHLSGTASTDPAAPTVEVTSLVHPSTAVASREAARMLGLDVAGVIVVTSDISAPLGSGDGAVVEVEGNPSLSCDDELSADIARRVTEAVLSTLYPPGSTARIPIAAITGVNGKTTTTRLLAHIMGVTGRIVGMTCTDGIFISGGRTSAGDCSGPQSARMVLSNPRVEAAVLETARGGLLREGVGFDHCDVGVVTNIGEGDHLGLGHITTVEQLARVKRIVVEAVAPTGVAVLNAEDPLVAAMAPSCPGSVIFFAVDPEHPVVTAHRAQGGRSVVVREGVIVFAQGTNETPLMPLCRVPLTHGGLIRFQGENALAAAAAAWSLGVSAEVIRTGLETFIPTTSLVPGRFNLLEVNGATVVFDYGHNASALKTILKAIESFPHERRLCVYSAAGDRRDCDLIDQGQLIGEAFDSVILYEDHYMRGRAEGEITSLFHQGASKGQRMRRCREVQGWVNALHIALEWLEPGDLALIQADVIDSAVGYMREYLANHPASREITLPEALAGAEPAHTPPLAAPTTGAAEPAAQQTNGLPLAGAPVEERVLTHPL